MVITRASSGGDYETPPAGLHQAVCIDVVDLGLQPTQWGDKHKVRIVWIIEAQDSFGRPFKVFQTYTNTLGGGNKVSALRGALESWRGKPFTKEELEGFDLDQVIGANCQLQVIHKAGDGGKVWANVQAIVPLGKHTPKMRLPADYVRVCDRPADQQPQRRTAPLNAPQSGMTLEKSYDPPRRLYDPPLEETSGEVPF